MSSNRGRGALTAAAFVATAAASFLLGRGCADAPVDVRRSDAAPFAEPPPVRADAPHPPVQTAPTPRKRSEPTPIPSIERSSTVAAGDETADGGACPSLDVVVERADRAPVADAVVYALPAGATGDGIDDVEQVPHAKTGADGRCKLTVPCDGRFDVGALVGEYASAELVAVDAPTDALVRVAAPQTARARFEVDAALLGRADHSLSLRGQGACGAVPGRGRFRRVLVDTSLLLLPPSLDLPKGVPFVLRADDAAARGIAVEPSPFRTPATVRVRVDERPLATAVVSCATPDVRPAADLTVRVAFRWDGDVESDGDHRGEWSFFIRAGQPLGPVIRDQFAVRVPAKGATLRWSGAGLRDGAARFDSAGRASFEVPVVLDVEESASTAKDRVFVLRATAPTGTTGDVRFEIYPADFDATTWDGAQVEGPVGAAVSCAAPSWRAGPFIAVAQCGQLVSEPRIVSTERETVLDLRPGGDLIVVPEAKGREALGAYRLRRKDGARFHLRANPQDEIPYVVLEADVGPGVLFGPIPAGDVAFVVTLAGVAIREVHATVKAGAYEPLRIPMGAVGK